MSEEFAAVRRATEKLKRTENLDATASEVCRTVDALVSRIGELQAREFVGQDSSGLIGARVDGTGRVVLVDITSFAIRDLPPEELGPRCVEAITAARGEVARALSTGLQDLTGTEIDFDAAPTDLAQRFRAASRLPS